MELTERVQRPLLAGVIFLDIVGYSRLTVETQYNVKKHFNRHIGDALQNVAAEERLMLDTGDGAAVCFFGRPEAALLSAIRLRHATMFEPIEHARYELRTGIHLGPVRVIRDLNGRLNVIGDGINDAQRIMSFAEPSQILSSEAFYELVSRGPRDHGRLFTYVGVRHDKHVKEHVVYEVGAQSAPARAAAPVEEPAPARVRRRGDSMPPSPVQQHRRDIDDATLLGSQGGQRPAPAPPQNPSWAPDAALIEGARSALVRLVGPVAEPMIRRAAQSSTSPSEFHLRLAAGIESDDDRMTFLELVGALGRNRH